MASVASCVTGLHRTLTEWPVSGSYREHLVSPHEAAGHRVDTFVVLVVPQGSATPDLAAVRAAYQPITSLTLFPETSLADLPTHRCNITSRTHMDAYQSVRQWLSVQRCFEDVETEERRLGQRYRWIYRTRTDVVFLSDTPLAGRVTAEERPSRSKRVYVPMGGMSGSRAMACQNDHVFVCPRALCRPYFQLVELWTSPHCAPAAAEQVTLAHRWGVGAPISLNARGAAALRERGGGEPGSIFASAAGEPSGVSGPPAAPYWLPPLPSRMDAHWYFFARYSDGRPCTTKV